MQISHFMLDAKGQFRRIRCQQVRKLLAGHRTADVSGQELQLATAVCRDDLMPQGIYLLRLPLTDGVFTADDRFVLRAFSRPDCVTPAEVARHHLSGWPRDLLCQLAVALDVSAAHVEQTLEVCGPVFIAAVKGISVHSALRKKGGR